MENTHGRSIASTNCASKQFKNVLPEGSLRDASYPLPSRNPPPPPPPPLPLSPLKRVEDDTSSSGSPHLINQGAPKHTEANCGTVRCVNCDLNERLTRKLKLYS